MIRISATMVVATLFIKIIKEMIMECGMLYIVQLLILIIAQGTSDNINQAIQYLKDKNVGVEVILDGRTA